MGLARSLRLAQESFPKGGCECLAGAVSNRLEDCQFAGIEPNGYLRLPLTDIGAPAMSGWLVIG
jgi:hypothetical protein